MSVDLSVRLCACLGVDRSTCHVVRTSVTSCHVDDDIQNYDQKRHHNTNHLEYVREEGDRGGGRGGGKGGSRGVRGRGQETGQ